MMRNNLILPSSLCLFLIIYAMLWCYVKDIRRSVLEVDYVEYTVPSKIVAPLSFEFKGIVSDFLFLKMITSIGDKIGKKKELTQNHSRYIQLTSDVITDLDPWFWDPYLFSSMTLAWGFGQYKEANDLLLKAKKYRTKDYKPPYYVGFNYFYFLKDNETASGYLMEASRLPGSPPYLVQLASRLSVYSAKHHTAILFLNEMLKNENNQNNAEQIKIRIKVLKIMDELESDVKKYHNKNKRYPGALSELVVEGFIKNIPNDPYGGEFYILENGRVYTTSEMRMIKRNQK